MSPESTGLTLILDDEKGNLKNIPELLGNTQEDGIVYAVSVEEARSKLGTEAPALAFVSCPNGPVEAETNLVFLGVAPKWLIAGATQDQASDPEFLRAAMQARFNDVLTVPTNAEDVQRAIENGVHHLHRETGGGGKVLVVYSSKGGVGVSSILVNLALALHKSSGLRICLLDVDLQGGSVATLLNIQPRQSLAKLGEVPIEDTTSMREEVISRISNHESGLRVLAAPSVIHDGVSITSEMITSVIKILRERFDIIIVDTPKWVGDRLVAALDEADRILLVADPEIPSLAKLRESLRLFSRFEFDQGKVELIFNRVDPNSELQPEEASEALSRKAYFSIPRETDTLIEAANTGSPPCAEETPKGIFANAIIEMVEKIKVDLGFPPSAPAPKKRGFSLRRKTS